MTSVYSQISANKQKTYIIMVLFIGFILGLSWLMSETLGFGLQFVGVALIFSGLMTFSSYYFSDRIILTLSGARPAERQKDFNLYTVTENLSMAARIPMPKLYVIEDTALNAFATGRDPEHAVVVATSGLIQTLDRSELEGVVAHELAHIKNYDIRVMSIVSILVGLVALLSDWFFRLSFYGRRSSDDNKGTHPALILLAFALALLSPLIANLIKLAVSRRREYLADASAAALTKYPEGLARALEKISKDREPLEAANKATAHLYIANPLKNTKDGRSLFAGLFSTHPPVEERISKLRSLR